MGGVLKAALKLEGSSLLARSLQQLQAAWPEVLARVTVVGDQSALISVLPTEVPGETLNWARENPPYAGPVAAIEAGLATVRQEFVLLLAADLVDISSGLRLLLAADSGRDGAILIDAEGFEQPLFGFYRVDALKVAIRSVASRHTAEAKAPSLRSAIARLELSRVPAPAEATSDIDHWSDAQRWGILKE